MTERVGSVERPSLEGPGGFGAVLFTDIQDSTPLWERYPDRMPEALARHHRIIEGSVTAVGGTVVKNIGDGFVMAFPDAASAVIAALQAQVALSVTAWNLDGDAISVRMAVDCGDIDLRDNDVGGPVVNRCARLMDVAHGGQILVSDDVVDRLDGGGVTLVDLGSFSLKGIAEPVGAHRVVLPTEVPSHRGPEPSEPGGIGWAVRGFELRERIGAGVAGVVYRAHQRSVGREVAIKLIRPEFANDRRFVHRFETEAQFIARLEHPHIVSLYDYWRDPDGAYLVMRWLRGGSLRQALERGPWREQSTVRLLQQVGSALAYAHRRGVIHRDVRPSNILLDEEGNGYLSDFGIASRPLAEGGGSVSTSSEYRSPEEIAGRPLTEATDQFCLAMVAHELLVGHRPSVPFRFELDDAVTSGFAQAIRQASAEDPADRFPSVEAFLAAVGPTLDLAAVETDVSRNPFKGLRPFLEADAADFFGRDQLVDRLVDAVAANRLVTVVGASGSGKSSAVRGGLVPALRRGAIAGSERWLVVDLYPGAHPFDELASALLSIATQPMPNLATALATDAHALNRAVKQIVPSDSQLVLIIDQFEELFTLTPATERRVFLDAITELVTNPHARARVVITLRADFYDRPLAFSRFAALLEPGLVSVPAPTREELVSAITEPSQAVGLSVDPALIDLILAEIIDQPGALPLLQYTLTELFENRTGNRLTTDLFTTVGGVKGSLGRRAETTYGSLGPDAKAACERIFLRLVSVEENTDDTRRRITRANLNDLSSDPGPIEQVMDAYGRHRLLTFDHDPTTRDPTVELAHEALLHGWPRLAGWINERRQDLITEHHLAAAVSEWEQSGRDPDHLLTGGRLAHYETWAHITDLTLTDTERTHLTEARLQENTRESRRQRVRRFVTTGFAIIALIATLFANYALTQERRAEREERSAIARELAAAATANLSEDPELSILLALEAIETTRSRDSYVVREAEEVLHEAVASSRLVWARSTPPWTNEVAWLPGGRLVVAGDSIGEIIDFATGDQIGSLPHPITAVAVSDDGQLLAIANGEDFVVEILDAASYSSITTLEGHSAPVVDIEFTPDGLSLASVAWDGTARVWDLDSGDPIVSLAHPCGTVVEGCAITGHVDVSADGRFFGVTMLGLPLVYDLSEMRPLDVEYYMDPSPVDLAFLPDGEHMAVGAFVEGTIYVFDTQTGEEVARLADHSGTVTSVELSPGGDDLLTASTGGGVITYQVVGSALIKDQSIPSAGWRVATEPEGRFLFTSNSSSVAGRVLAFDLSPVGASEVAAFGTSSWPAGVALSPDGRRLATGHPQGGVAIWDVASQDLIEHFDDPVPEGIMPVVAAVAFSPDGSLVAASGERYELTAAEAEKYGGEEHAHVGWVRVWNLESGTVVFDPYPPQLGVYSATVGFSRDGTRFAVTTDDDDADAVVYDTATWERVFEARSVSQFDSFGGIGLSPDGSLVVTQAFGGSDDLTVEMWDIATGQRLWAVADSKNLGGTAIFNRSGDLVLTSGFSSPSVWNAATGELIFVADGDIGTTRTAWTEDGGVIASAARDGTIRLWNARDGSEMLTLRGHEGEVWDVSFDGSGTLLASVDASNLVRVWTLDLDRLIEIARDRLTRDFTDDECRTYLHLESCSER